MPDYTGRGPDGRKLLAIVHADMVGYSRLIELDDVGTLARLRILREHLIDPTLQRHGGQVVQTAGDSLLIIFDSITEAVGCAIHLQRELPAYNHDHPADRAILFRMGIEMGDVIADRADFHGNGVNVAARLQAECPAGGICVSRTVRDHVGDRLDLAFEAIGPLVLKNINRPVEAFVLRFGSEVTPAAAPAPAVPYPRAADAPRLSMVILPFTSLGGTPAENSIADAITDDLTHELAAIPGHLVIACTSAAAYKARSIDVRRVGAELGVRYVIEGSVRQIGDMLRVNVQLVSAMTNTRLWGDRLEQDFSDPALGQDKIIQRLRGVLDLQVLDAEIAQAERERPGKPDAYDLVLRAWSGWSKTFGSDHLQQMTDILEQALRLDPRSVPALWSLADWLIHRYSAFLSNPDWGKQSLIERAADALSVAAAIEPNNERVLYSQGALLRVQGRWVEARAIVNRLLLLFPNNASGYRLLGRIEMNAGRPMEAIVALKANMHLDPLSTTMWGARSLIGNCLVQLGRDAEGIEALQQALAETPTAEHRGRAYRHLYLASAYALTGDLPSARREVDSALGLWPYATARNMMPGMEPRGLPSPAYAKLFRRVSDGLRLAGLRDHAAEANDFFVPSSSALYSDVDGLTPLAVPGATTIQTEELGNFLGRGQPLLIDIALGSWGRSIPGAIGLQGSGDGAEFSKATRVRVVSVIRTLTNGDLSAPVVAFCANSERFTGYNLALRLVSLGYTQVYWYRGGFESWQMHGLPEEDLKLRNW